MKFQRDWWKLYNEVEKMKSWNGENQGLIMGKDINYLKELNTN